MSVVERIRAERVIAVLRRAPDVDAAVAAVRAAGISLVEITLDSPDALEAIARHPGVLAGTVRTAAEVDAAVAAGASAVVSPGFIREVVARASRIGVPAIPGAFSPTEVEAAWRAGAALVKLFPAWLGGPEYVRSLHEPLGDVPLVVAGGVDSANARALLDAGAAAVAVGGALLRPGEAARLVRSVGSDTH